MSEQYKTESKNLEFATLVWLDKYVYEQQNEQVSTTNDIPTREQLRSIINCLKVFDQSDVCENYILSIDKQDEIVLIVSGTYGEEILPKIHNLKQLRSVYIYCMNEQEHQNWTKQFPKIRGIFNNSDRLLTKLNIDQKISGRLSEISFTFFSRNKDIPKQIQQQKILTKQNGEFLWFQLFIELASHTITNDSERHKAKKDLIDELQRHLRGNENAIQIINDFEKNYEAEHALWWYTKVSFCYSVMNKALRTYNFDTIISFRMFIADMYQSLKDYYEEDQQHHKDDNNDQISVYRGQAISDEQLNQIKKNKNELMSFNNFLSTSTNRQTGLFYIESSDAKGHGLHPILFEFKVNSSVKTKPYTDVSRFSQFPVEEEVLFMIGTICRIDDIFHNDVESIWIARLTIMNDDNYELHAVLESLKKHRKNDNSLISLANILEEMSEYEKAEKIVYRCLTQSSTENMIDRYNCYDLLGTLAGRNGNFDEAIKYHLQSIELQKQITPIDLKQLALTYNNLGKSYGYNGQIDLSLSSLLQSNQIKIELFNDQNHFLLAATYENIGNCYFAQNKLDRAQESFQRAFDIRQIHGVLENSPESIEYYMSVGNIFGLKNRLSDATDYHTKAIQIAEQVLPLDHPQLASCYNNLGKDYADQKQYRLARENYQHALNIYEQTVPDDHPERQRTQDNLDEIPIILWTEAGKLLLIAVIILLPIVLYISR